ncbi:MAG: hypothetical protein Q9159_000269 [Coniocarpon cinnabarinum]
MQAVQTQPIDAEKMSSHLQTFSALQSLLAFQCLAAHRPESNAFAQVAHSLRSNKLFTGSEQPDDPHTFSGETLRGLYEETLSSLSGKVNGESKQSGTSDGPEKSAQSRGHESPQSQAAGQVPVLYETYKQRIITDIQAEERRYRQLLDELKSLEAVNSQELAPEPNRAEVKVDRQQSDDGKDNHLEKPGLSQTHPAALPKADPDDKGEGSKPSTVQEKSHPRRSNASLDLIINHDEPGEEKQARPSTAGSGTTSTVSFSHHDAPYPPSSTQNPPHSAYSGSPNLGRDPRNAIDPRQTPSTRTGQPLSHVSPRSPTSPVILPPPPGLNPPPFPPTSPYVHHAETPSGSAYRVSGSSPTNAFYPPHDSYAPHRYSEAYASPQFHRDPHRPFLATQPLHRQPYPSHQPQTQSYPIANQQPQPPRGGVMLPPFQVSPRATGSAQFPQPAPASTTNPSPPARPTAALDRSNVRNERVNTPTRATSTHNRPTPLSAPHTAHLRDHATSASPGSSTVWRHSLSKQIRERSPPRSVSPPTDPESTPVPAKPIGPARGRRAKAVKASDSRPTPPVARTSQDRSHSQSPQISESFSSAHGRRPRREMLSTTATSNDGNDRAAMPDTAKPKKAAQPAKRKRTESVAEEAATTQDIAVEPVGVESAETVVAYRNFGKMAQPVMNVIASHKHASLFAEPVRERQAEGYRDIIKRPQDLKSIRTAIAAGTRAVAAAIDAQQASPGTQPSSSGSGNAVVLPVSEALVPPRGIVNAAQLEQEIMRMFANAVMFNPGDDEIVQDSREMFESVEQALQQWRDVERMEEVEEAAREEEEGSTVSSSKRRRL